MLGLASLAPIGAVAAARPATEGDTVGSSAVIRSPKGVVSVSLKDGSLTVLDPDIRSALDERDRKMRADLPDLIRRAQRDRRL